MFFRVDLYIKGFLTAEGCLYANDPQARKPKNTSTAKERSEATKEGTKA